MLQQHNLKFNKKAYKKAKTVGRGNGSGHGSFSGKGCKGQLARTGKKIKPWFEGGQTNFIQKIAKKGFKRATRVEHLAVNVGDLEIFNAGTTITKEFLMEQGIVAKNVAGVKILSTGELTKKLFVKLACSATAKAKIEKAGGSVEPPTKREPQVKKSREVSDK